MQFASSSSPRLHTSPDAPRAAYPAAIGTARRDGEHKEFAITSGRGRSGLLYARTAHTLIPLAISSPRALQIPNSCRVLLDTKRKEGAHCSLEQAVLIVV
jgi:hypothetical protein